MELCLSPGSGPDVVQGPSQRLHEGDEQTLELSFLESATIGAVQCGIY